MLLTNDLTATAARLDAGQLACPSCGGKLGPWGHARQRVARGDNSGPHRRVAELVDRPATTVRDWLRRARANSDLVRGDVTLAALLLDPSRSGTAAGDGRACFGAPEPRDDDTTMSTEPPLSSPSSVSPPCSSSVAANAERTNGPRESRVRGSAGRR